MASQHYEYSDTCVHTSSNTNLVVAEKTDTKEDLHLPECLMHIVQHKTLVIKTIHKNLLVFF